MISGTLESEAIAPRHCGFIRLNYHTLDLERAAMTLPIKIESVLPSLHDPSAGIGYGA